MSIRSVKLAAFWIVFAGSAAILLAQTTGQPGAISGVIGVSQQRGLIPALAIEVVDANGNQVTSFGGSGITATDNGTVAGGQTAGLGIGLQYLWNGANWIRQPLGLLDSGGGDATDPVNHAIKVVLPIGANVTATISGTPAVQGNKSTNAAIPGTNNIGVLPCVYNAISSTTTETFQGAISCNLLGQPYVVVANAAVLGQGAASGANPVVQAYPQLVSGGTAAMTSTSSTSVISAVTSNYIYVTGCTVGNSHATQGTFVDLQDGLNGTVLWTFPAAPAYGGAAPPFPTPLKVPTQGHALFAADETNGANVKVFCQGFASTVSY
jgi:hypothetical protein